MTSPVKLLGRCGRKGHFSEIVARRVKSVFQVACRGSDEFNSGTQVYCMSHSGRVDSKNVRQNAESSVESMRYRGSYKFKRRAAKFCWTLLSGFLHTSKIKSYLRYYDSISQNVGIKRETLDR